MKVQPFLQNSKKSLIYYIADGCKLIVEFRLLSLYPDLTMQGV